MRPETASGCAIGQNPPARSMRTGREVAYFEDQPLEPQAAHGVDALTRWLEMIVQYWHIGQSTARNTPATQRHW